MHAKTVIFDEYCLCAGSANLTHNAMENNKEHVARITEERVVWDALADFNDTWGAATPVTEERVQAALAKQQAAAAAAAAKKIASEQNAQQKEKLKRCSSDTVSTSTSRRQGKEAEMTTLTEKASSSAATSQS